MGHGSSPLTRGKRGILRTSRSVVGLIPAHAGKTRASLVSAWAGAAHPRSRGENTEATRGAALKRGSSPLTRGKRGLHGARPARSGLIPAHAGKTRVSQPSGSGGGAHPRSRGENAGGRVFGQGDGGSSPLTRGKLVPRALAANEGRLIPAHAGKTPQSSRAARPFAAHPRSRGENTQSRHVSQWRLGSSPLTRGKRSADHSPHSDARLIPAHAGKTSGSGCARSRQRAHPRSRGENFNNDVWNRLQLGSSPLTRGKQRKRRPLVAPSGLIPAHAGKTNQGAIPRAVP